MNLKRHLWLSLFATIFLSSKLGAQTFTTIANFTNASAPVYGDDPSGQFAVNGNMLYGTAQDGGATNGSGYGVVYSVGANGNPGLIVLHSFTNSEGAYPNAGVVLGNGTLYGTAAEGGNGNAGTVFSVSTNGSNFTVLHYFGFGDANNGAIPLGRLLLTNGALYGTTQNGGSAFGSGSGTLFSIATNGTNFKLLHSFSGNDGANPQADLVLGGATLYGTTDEDSTNGPSSQLFYGNVFSYNLQNSNFTVLHTFTNSPDGSTPVCGLVLAGGMLYGTTDVGGTNGASDGGYGTIFSLATNGSNYSVIHNFNKSPDGEYIKAGLTLAGGTLYGAASSGGVQNSTYGTLFSISTNGGNFTIVHGFLNGVDGYYPGSLVFANGAFYGTAQGGEIFTGGGIPSDGVVYSFIPPTTPIPLAIQRAGNEVILTWNDPYAVFSLQASTNVLSGYTNILYATSPFYYNYAAGASNLFFRLSTQ